MPIPVVRRRWPLACLLAYAAVIALIVLSPISFADAVNAISEWMRGVGLRGFGSGWIEFTANIFMFLPLGLLLTLVFRHPWWGVVLALVVSAGVELVQIVIPSRETSLRDVLANVLGAAIGALLAWVIVLRRERRRATTSVVARPAD